MKQIFQFIITYYLIAVCLGIMILTYFFLQRNPASQVSSLKRQAKREYLDHQYKQAVKTYQLLSDSFKIQDAAASLNHANAAFLSIDTPAEGDSAPDTTNYAEISSSGYAMLTSSNDPVIASLAANQMGFAMVKAKGVFSKGPASIDSALRGSLVYFKEALLKDPENEPARYNYELVRKLVDYPENVIKQTKKLVAQRKYVQAADYLQRAMGRDKRLTAKEHKELLIRISQVAGIAR